MGIGARYDAAADFYVAEVGDRVDDPATAGLELHQEIGTLRDRLSDKLDANLRILLFSMLSAVFTTAVLAFGAAQL